MKYIYMVTKPKSSKTVIACEFASSAIEAMAIMIQIGPYLAEDTLSKIDKDQIEFDLKDNDQAKISTCKGNFKITKIVLY